MRREATYPDVRSLMKPGDVIAFGGKGQLSDIIKWATRAPVSHVGVIFTTRATYDAPDADRYMVNVIESTTLAGAEPGVQVSQLSTRLKAYDGQVWWLPLRDDVRATRFDERRFFDFLLAQKGKGYDYKQAIGSGLDLCDFAGLENTEDFERFFCSELVAAALEEAGVVVGVNASEITPIDLCRWPIYADAYTQILGDPREIPRYNGLA